VKLFGYALAIGAALSLATGASAQLANDKLAELMDAREIPVTLDNFARAALSRRR
jgi:hypothetical protein